MNRLWEDKYNPGRKEDSNLGGFGNLVAEDLALDIA